MALPTKCQTPGAQYTTHIYEHEEGTAVEVKVELPFSFCIGMAIGMTDAEIEQLEANLHNALELVLAPYFIQHV